MLKNLLAGSRSEVDGYPGGAEVYTIQMKHP